MDFEYFRSWLVEGLGYGDGSKGGRPPFDLVAMFNILILQAQHNHPPFPQPHDRDRHAQTGDEGLRLATAQEGLHPR